ncbi:protein kinase [Balneolaceae bacterium YR4-1]|uniref:non-specific serine/threonine protein kinase n=1 Tax=Halalkalibaculum roseum TaxID=2709311 RepID=A0A6M1SJA4_9BACT|nr:bifunctional serine/threonine-protein kinase/formylglycine-generating enzyme family protein [Halalkalibaculum roseum]NGP75099.1 protein kinase [Halalkalibaculum roseum]
MIGQSINQYKIISKLGSGGMSIVYKALDTKLDRFVALKFLFPHLSQTEDVKTRFMLEAKTASSLDHPNICPIYDIGETEDDRLYIIMPCYEGKSLREKINEGPIPIDDAVEIAIQAARGLSKTHSKDIVHRDIKPGNIMFSEDGEVKIVDFGLAKLEGRTLLTTEGTTLGTVSYMSPEQSTGKDVNQKTDIWSLGVILYEMLTGERPFKGNYEQAVIYSIINDEPQPIRDINPKIPKELARIVHRALEKDVKDRYASINNMLEDLENLYGNTPVRNDIISLLKKPVGFVSVGVILVMLCIGGIWLYQRQANIQWARQDALPKIELLAERTWSDYSEIYTLASQAEEYIPNDPKLTALLDKSSLYINVHTDPEGAAVYVKDYNHPDNEWRYLGTSPIDSIRVPIGIFRWKVEKEGYDTVLAAAATWDANLTGDLFVPNDFFRELDKEGSIPAGMVRVKGTDTPIGKLDDFFIGRFEVTNKEFKEFIDDGGYRNKAYWQHQFIYEDQILSWENAISKFVDQTERPGPSTWQEGSYPEGQGDYPVSGISWYEAAAYAVYKGMSLPTGTHWGLARGESTPLIRFPQMGGFAVFAPFNNFGEHGPVAVGSMPGYTSYGAYDMAGNVREWCWNETQYGKLIRGGAWSDNTYTFSTPSQAPPFDRSSINGIRLAYYPDEASIPKAAFDPFQAPPEFNFYEQEPVSNEIFNIYKDQFAYDPSPLDSEIVSRDTTSEYWIHERLEFNAAYAGERIIGHLFLPKNAPQPYQTVIYFPGVGSLYHPNSENMVEYYEFPTFLSYLLKNGRAVFYPVYQGTFERRRDHLAISNLLENAHMYTEFLTQVVKDFKRSVDYLNTREEIDNEKIAYYGMSWGGNLGAIIPAVEDRLKASILISGALSQLGRPEVNQINYIGRVETPTLMLNGIYDSLNPYNTSIKPMFDLLGTPVEHKKLITYETDHIPPKIEYVKESLSWLDQYLGPVQ